MSRGLRNVDITSDFAQERLDKAVRAYNAAQKRSIGAKKRKEYGKGEVFAVTNPSSYPLTKNGKPSKERTLAAWRYINEERNAKKLGAETAAKAKRKIRAFYKKHFGQVLKSMTTSHEGQQPAKQIQDTFVFADTQLWRLSKGLSPDPVSVKQAWREVHSMNAHQLLGPEVLEVAEARIAYYAQQHQIDLTEPKITPLAFM